MAALLGGAAIGTIGGLIGLGGAEFRLPLLLTLFSFVALEAVILNKAISLVVVLSALVFRSSAVPFGDVFAQWPIIVNLLAGSLAGAWLGADLATRVSTTTLYRVIAVCSLSSRSCSPSVTILPSVCIRSPRELFCLRRGLSRDSQLALLRPC